MRELCFVHRTYIQYNFVKHIIYTHTHFFLLCVLRLLEAMFLLPETCLLFMFVPTQPNGPSKVNSFCGPTPRHLDSRNRMFQTHGIYIFGVLMFGQCCLALQNGKFTCLTMFFPALLWTAKEIGCIVEMFGGNFTTFN